MRLAVVQRASAIGSSGEDPRPRNLESVESAVADAAAARAELVVFGEMFLTGLRTDAWLSQWSVHIDDADDDAIHALTKICRQHRVNILIGSGTVDRHRACRNSLLFVTEDGLAAIYHKRHLARIELPNGYRADERDFYTDGDLPPIIDTRWGRLGVQICYEVTFPEVARCAALDDVDAIINCTASISGSESVWAAMAQARAFENATYFVVASVVGDQGTDHYFGGSAVFGPDGACLGQAADDDEDMLVVDIDMTRSRAARQLMNIAGGRRPELYQSLTRRATDNLA